MYTGIADQVAEDLAEGAGVAVDTDVRVHLRAHRDASFLQQGLLRQQDFVDHLGQSEGTPLRAALVDGDLLEAADQFGSLLQIACGDGRRVQGVIEKGRQRRFANGARFQVAPDAGGEVVQ